jgi:hypothetical protein
MKQITINDYYNFIFKYNLQQKTHSSLFCCIFKAGLLTFDLRRNNRRALFGDQTHIVAEFAIQI